jgi:MFS family permease
LDESNDQILNEWFKCTSNDFCTSNETLEWKIDWTNEESLHNWVEEFDLYCTPKYVIGLMGSSFFIASVLSSLIFPRLADLFGRKKIFLVGFYMNTITLIIFLF